MPGDFVPRESDPLDGAELLPRSCPPDRLEKIHCLPGGGPARHRHGDWLRGPHRTPTIDVYGSPGEYCGAFNMGARFRVHGHAQNFTGMVMHSGTLEIHGDVGKVTGYCGQGRRTFHILGNVVDRGWVCAVSDPRGPGLESEYRGNRLRTPLSGPHGRFGPHAGPLSGSRRDRSTASFSLQGAKILAGASAGEVIFYDPNRKLEEAQYQSCKSHPVDDQKWIEIVGRIARSGEPLQPRVPQKKRSSHR